MRHRFRGAPGRGGILFKLLVVLAGLFALAALGWMVLLPYCLTAQLRERTGFDASVATLMVNPFTGELRARGLVVGNPPTFPRPEFLQVRELDLDADVFSLFSSKPVLNRVTLDIALVALVKRADGRTNAEVFRGYLADPAGRPAAAARTERHFLIRRLDLRFDRLLLADYTGRQPVVRDYPVKLDRTFANVSDSRQLMLPASLDQLFALGGAVGGLLPEDVGRVVENALHSGKDLLKGALGPDKHVFNSFSDTLEESKKP
jgi:hypothetical protein